MRAAARQPADRELRDRARGRLREQAEDRGRRLPRLERRPRRAACARGARRGGGRRLARRERPSRRRRASSSRAGSRTATTSAAAPSPASRRRCERSPSSPRAAVPVLGICNGFQILCEAGLLPGVLRPNASLSFVCRDVGLRVERTDTPFTARCEADQILTIPIKHGEGCWFADDGAPRRARGERADRPPLRRTTRTARSHDVAGVVNAEGNVMGLMPHPEHAVDPLLGSTDGALILGGLVDAARDRLLMSTYASRRAHLPRRTRAPPRARGGRRGGPGAARGRARGASPARAEPFRPSCRRSARAACPSRPRAAGRRKRSASRPARCGSVTSSSSLAVPQAVVILVMPRR